MPTSQLTVRVPGKLMVAGEFAVLEPHQKLVVMAVDRFVFATLQPGLENQLTLENFGLKNLPWHFSNDQVTIDSDDSRTNFVRDAMTIALTYLQENSITPPPFSLTIHSELDDESGVKYGLGSSAAVVVSVLSSILETYLPTSPSEEVLFKLAAISHIKTQGNGSGADIAASVYGGLLEYSSFQAAWLQTAYKQTPLLTDLLQKNWVYFSIRRLKLPENTYLCVGWTGKPASTKHLVDKILHLKKSDPKQFITFLTDSEKAVSTFTSGVDREDLADIFAGIEANRLTLRTIGEQANVEIETPLLGTLSDLARLENGAGKLSGAGGGDCGIAVVSSQKDKESLHAAWEQVNIKPLEIDLHPTGSEVVK